MESEELEKKRKRKLEDEDAPVQGRGSRGFFPPELKSSDIRKRVLQRFSRHEYKQLRQDLLNYGLTEQGISDFFLKEGDVILRRSLVSSSSDQSLKFLIETVPVPAFQEVLRRDNFSVLRSFLYAQVGREQSGLYNQHVEEIHIEKFKVLLTVDRDAITGFIKENAHNQHLYTDKIRIKVEKALNQLAESAKENVDYKESSTYKNDPL
jgi:hypothetical protein